MYNLNCESAHYILVDLFRSVRSLSSLVPLGLFKQADLIIFSSYVFDVLKSFHSDSLISDFGYENAYNSLYRCVYGGVAPCVP